MKGSHFESHAWARLGWALGPNLRLPSGWTSRKCSTDNFLSPIFLLTLSSYMTDQRGTFTIKNATLCFYMYFLDIFCCFSSKKNVFLSFSFLFLMKHLVSTTDYIETGIGDTKLSVEQYVSAVVNIKWVCLPPCQLPIVGLGLAGSNSPDGLSRAVETT